MRQDVDLQNDSTQALRPSRVAKLLDCSPALVRKLMREGKLGYCMVGADRRVPVHALREYLNESFVRQGGVM